MEIEIVGTDKVSIVISPKCGSSSILSLPIVENRQPIILDVEGNQETSVVVILRDVKEKWMSGYYQELRRLAKKKWPWFDIDSVQDGVDGDTGLEYLKIFMERLETGYYIDIGWNHKDDVTVFGLKTMIEVNSGKPSISQRFNNLDWQTSRHAHFWTYTKMYPDPDATLFNFINLPNIYFLDLEDLSNPKFLEWLQEKDERWKEVKEIPHLHKTINIFRESIDRFWKDYSEDKIEMLKDEKLLCYLYPEQTRGVDKYPDIIAAFIKEIQIQIDFVRQKHPRYLKMDPGHRCTPSIDKKQVLKVKINYPEKVNFSSFYHPFRCETKSFYVDHVEDESEADIVYNNIYDYRDKPKSAYENKDLILIPHPLYNKKVNDEHNIVIVPLVMHEQDKIIFDKTFLSECRKNRKKYEYGYIGDIYKGRLELKDLELDSYFFKDTSNDTIWHLNENDKVDRIKDFLNEVSLSKFTFCPRGNGSSSFRLFESLEAGSVPIVTGMLDYPFIDEVDWDSFSIRGESIEDLPVLIEKSKNLTDKEYEVMRQNGIDFWEQYCRLDKYHDWVITEFLL